MDWRDIAKLIAPLAPAAGSILGGFIPFPGGSLIGQKFGELLARQFGVQTPAELEAAIANNPNEVVVAKINAAMVQARAEIEGFVAIEKAWAEVVKVGLEQVNETMRAELGHEHWYFNGWRPACGWLLVIFMTVFGLILVAAVIGAAAGMPALLNAVKEAQIMAGSFVVALAATVGVYIFNRSKEKTTLMPLGATATPPAKRK